MTRMTRVSEMWWLEYPNFGETGPGILGCLGMIGITGMTVMTGMRRLTAMPRVTGMAKIWLGWLRWHDTTLLVELMISDWYALVDKAKKVTKSFKTYVI